MIITKDSYFLFSGSEIGYNLQHSSLGWSDIIILDYSMNAFMAACQHKEVVKRHGVLTNLIYPYFPYARQDRVMTDYTSFSLKIFCGLLNSQKFDKVTIYDPHSDVAPALIDNCEVISQWEIAREILPKEFFSDRNLLFVSPDAGAYKKLSKLITDDTRIAIGVKNRSTEGVITGTGVYSSTPIKDHDCLIINDICDGGSTFIELAKILKFRGANKVYLYITHGIFSKGMDVLKESIDHIYTTDSFSNTSTDYLSVLDIFNKSKGIESWT